MSRLSESHEFERPTFGVLAVPLLNLHEVLSLHLHKHEKSAIYEGLKTCLLFEYPLL